MRWPFTFIVDKLPIDPENRYGGQVLMFLIFIKKQYENDEGLYQHELVHVKQFFYRGLIIHNLRYAFSKSYRYRCEIEGYRKQLEYWPGQTALYVSFICNKYNLDVDPDDVRKDLLK